MADTERLSPQEVEIQGLLESAKDDPILSVQLQERLKDAKIDRLEHKVKLLSGIINELKEIIKLNADSIRRYATTSGYCEGVLETIATGQTDDPVSEARKAVVHVRSVIDE